MNTYSVETKLGTFSLTPIKNTEISIRVKAKVRGVPVSGSLHAKLTDLWRITDVCLYRTDKTPDYISPAAKNTVVIEAEGVVRQWVKENTEVFNEVYRDMLIAECQACSDTIIRLKKELKEAEQAWEIAKEKLHQFNIAENT